MDGGPGGDAALEQHDEPVVKAPVDTARPGTERRIAQFQPSANSPVELMKHDVYGNGVRVPAVDSRRIDKVIGESPKVRVGPTIQLIGNEPPHISQEMRAAKGGDSM